MKVISAYLLAVVGGNASPSADDVTAILGSVGISLDADGSAQLDSLIAEMEGKTTADVLAAGAAQIATIPGGGCGGGSSGGAAAASGDAPAAEAKEEKKKSSSSEDVGGGGGMFDDDY
eukprot:TRINITY_DN484_c0_g1_i1.p3 TRINITY_DN484_c0_g1~~TRINITY_DN484_c0_g1_i1.p3  ORF type:complete len:118 (+),score=29.16 TRINITY_DN484_c0_g1_i1:244-597(+)